MSLAALLLMFAGDETPFVAGAGYATTTTSQAVSFTGALAGDLAVVILEEANSNTVPTGWTRPSTTTFPLIGNVVLAYKVLTSGDITAGSVTFTNTSAGGGLLAAFYRGPTVATAVSSASVSAATSLTIPGVTKNAASKALLTYCVTLNNAASMTPPSAYTQRIAAFNFPTSGTSMLVDLPPTGYVNSTDIVWTGLPASGEQAGQIIELT